MRALLRRGRPCGRCGSVAAGRAGPGPSTSSRRRRPARPSSRRAAPRPRSCTGCAFSPASSSSAAEHAGIGAAALLQRAEDRVEDVRHLAQEGARLARRLGRGELEHHRQDSRAARPRRGRGRPSRRSAPGRSSPGRDRASRRGRARTGAARWRGRGRRARRSRLSTSSGSALAPAWRSARRARPAATPTAPARHAARHASRPGGRAARRRDSRAGARARAGSWSRWKVR